MRGLPPHRYESHGVCFLSNGHLQPHFTEKRKPRGGESLDPKQDHICSKSKSDITPRFFKCLPLPQPGKKQVEKGEGRKAYLLGEENLGGIPSLFYRNPVQKDITVLRKKEGLERHPPQISPSRISRLLPSAGPSDLQSPFFRCSPHPLPSHSPIGTSRPFASRCRLQPALDLPEPCSLPAHLLHNADDASDEGVRVLVLLSTGVQVHATFLKHHLGTEPVRGGTQTQEDSRGRGPQALPGRPRGGAKR